MKEKTITLNTQEQKRAMVLNRIQAGQLSVAQAAGVLDLSARHVRRILAAYEKEGPAALAHGNRGRKPAHRISDPVRAQVVDLAGRSIKAVTSNSCAICCTNGRVSRSRAHRCAGSWSKPGWLGRDRTNGASIGDGANATRRKGCCCRLTAAAMPGCGSEDRG
jgi:winged helix-turn helix protein